MALPRKRPGAILKRDTDFTRTIGKPGTDKPNPFAMLGQDLVAKLESARTTEAAEPPSAPSAAVEEPERTHDISVDVPPTEGQPETPAPQSEAAPEGLNAHPRNAAEADEGREAEGAPETSDGTGQAPEAASQPKAGRAGDADAPADVVITMRIPTGLVKRAQKWATAVGLPVAAVLRNSFNRFKPELMKELQTVKAGDVHLDRPESVGHHMQARLRFTAAEYADMEARLDPARFGMVPSMLNHYARALFSSFLDGLLTDAGY